MRRIKKTLGSSSVQAPVLVSILMAVVLFFLVIAEASAYGPSGGLNLASQKPGKAKLVKGKAIPPKNAPKRVKRVIEAANKIRRKPYVWGGGHGSFNSRGYDCSGAVSFALRGGRFISRPMASGPLMNWGKRGQGDWITVYSNPGHAYIIVAGLRFDTAGTGRNGPRWSKSKVSIPGASFVKRHPKGY